MATLQYLFITFSIVILSYYLLLHLYYFFLLMVSFREVWVQPRLDELLVPTQLETSPETPPVSVIVPAHNEEATITESVQALLGLRYPKLQIVVVNDGSRDGTLTALIQSFSLRRADVTYHSLLPSEPVRGIYLSNIEPRLLVIDKVQGGKSDALNAGVNLCESPWICSVDADSILEEEALLRIMRWAIEDDRVVACSGIVRVVNGCRVAGGRVVKVSLPSKPLVTFQVVEYLQAFMEGRLGWSRLNALLIISGAFGLFRTDVIRAINGYSRETIAEDMEVVVRIHRYFREQRKPYRVLFLPDPVCWTEAPTQVSELRQQRQRWQHGLAEVLNMHRDLFFRPRMGRVGWLAMPYFLLELVDPVFELFGFIVIPLAWAMGWVELEILLLFIALALLMGIVFDIAGVLLEEISYRRYTAWRDLARLLFYALVKHIGYQQLLTWFRMEGLFRFMRGRRGWGKQVRVGFRRPSI